MSRHGADVENERMIRQLVEGGVLRSESIISAFRKVKRGDFAQPEYARFAYHDAVLPGVGESTLSAPHAVAAMLEELEPGPGDRVLEVGTGSGYNACLISECVGPSGMVVSIEIDEAVAEAARANLERYGQRNIMLVVGDGLGGYQELALYDRIIYTCAIAEIQESVVKQLKVGGKLLAPVGGYTQLLTSLRRVSKTLTETKELGHYLFVSARKGKI